MDPLFHFVFAVIAGLAVNVKLKHRLGWVVFVAFSAVAIDVDHFLFAYPRTFHSLFVTVGLPAVLFFVAYRRERGGDRIRLQSLVLLLFVMLNGHLVADMLREGAVRLFYPLSDVAYGVPGTWELTLSNGWYLVSGDGVALALYGGIIGLAYFAEEFIYFVERQHESVDRALRDSLGLR